MDLGIGGSRRPAGPRPQGCGRALRQADARIRSGPDRDFAAGAARPVGAVQSDTLGHAGPGRDAGPTDGGGAGGQPALAVYRCPVSRLRARRARRRRPAPQGRRRPADGFQHSRRRLRRRRGGRHGQHFRRLLGRGAVRHSPDVRHPVAAELDAGADVPGHGGGPDLPAVGAARHAGDAGSGTPRSARATAARLARCSSRFRSCTSSSPRRSARSPWSW